jgi:hypothetical protein
MGRQGGGGEVRGREWMKKKLSDFYIQFSFNDFNASFNSLGTYQK